LRKLAPLLIAAWIELEVLDHPAKKSLNGFKAAESPGIATVRFNNPFGSSHDDWYSLMQSWTTTFAP
jgi:hypothetical protein